MATIDAKGLSQSVTAGFGEGSLQHGGAGLSAAVTTVLAQSNMDVSGQGLSSSATTAFGQLVKFVKLVSVLAINSTRIRFIFDRAMKKDASLLAPFNYPIATITPGAANVTSNDVEPENVDEPTFVDVLTSEMTDGASYDGSVSAIGGPVDIEDTPMDAAANSGSLTGIGDPPGLLRVVPISENRSDVVFDEPMSDNADIRDVARYTWDNGLATISVLDVLPDGTVQLVTSDQTPGTLYTLTVTP